MFLRRNRLVALLAAFAVMLQVLWPLLSHARPQDSSLLVPVCTIDGITHYLDLKTGKTPLDERTALHGEHCKLCFFGGDRLQALSSASVDFLQVPAVIAETPAELPASHYRSTSASPAHPRAPPASS
jgi:hypothetical protein